MKARRLVSLVLAVALLFTGFATPKTAEAAEQQAKKYVCDGFDVEFKVTDEYENMFHADVTVTNTGNETLRDWAFSCEFVHEITNIWNARVLGTQEEFCVIGNYDWNQNIAPGGTASFGFSAKKTDDGKIVFPEAFALVMREKEVDKSEYAVDFVVYSDWGAGNNGALILKNMTGRRIHNWEISFAYDREIVEIANAVIVSYENGIYTLRNAEYNADLEPYGTVHISFNGGQGTGAEKTTDFVMTEIVFDTEVHPKTLSGTVTEEVSGSAVSGALVQALQDGVVVNSTLTDENGNYFLDLFKGEYTLRVEKEHFYPEEMTIVSRMDAELSDVVLAPVVYELTGVVTDKDSGEVLSGIAVTVSGEDGVVAETVTDENGMYSVGLYHKEYQIEFAGTNYVSDAITVTGGETENGDVALEREMFLETGYVVDSETQERVGGVSVTLKNGDEVVSTDVTDENGDYSVAFYPGEYTVVFEKDGYEIKTVTRNNEESVTIFGELICPEIYEVAGTVKNAVNGDLLEGVAVKVYEGSFATEEEIPADAQTVAVLETAADGSFAVKLAKGAYTLVFEKEDYITGVLNVESVKGVDEQIMALSPVLRDNEYRIVLTWGSAPRDLDSYLDIYENGMRLYQVYYGRKQIMENGEVIATLDIDDTNGYGPETVTVTVFTEKDRKYSYRVNCFSSTPTGSVQFAESDATVTVYCGDELVKTYTVPENQVNKNWEVFDIIDGQIVDR